MIIGHISAIAKTVAESVEEQEATSKSVAINVQSAATKTSAVASRVREVTNGANETGDASVTDVCRTPVGRKLSAKATVGQLLEQGASGLGRPRSWTTNDLLIATLRKPIFQ
ncbi:hypothetical protein [Bradyrhizobium zhanjiangense]|uniref:hypothetical protein n=1 Tax=Bradyrhizobium zhanjiangense TaxID=1325107 RepID=UPI001008E25F|nr:hypothetical protein [Bradyrhizobium zhanjiangense]